MGQDNSKQPEFSEGTKQTDGDITLSEQGVIEWKINGDSLHRFKNAKFEDLFLSPRFNAIGCRWYFRIYPNGYITEGISYFFLNCTSIESKEKELNVSYYIDSASVGYSQINIDGQ
eukprot:1078325_1